MNKININDMMIYFCLLPLPLHSQGATARFISPPSSKWQYSDLAFSSTAMIL